MNVATYVICVAVLFCGAAPAGAAEPDLVGRGKYLALASDCVACHTVLGKASFTGGREFKLPFGSLFTPNITADKETGIGLWSDDDFVSAVQHGVGKDGKHYYPAFPFTSYSLMSREDVLAIKAYLFSLAPIHEPSKDDNLVFPFNQRWGMVAWNWMFFDDKRFEVSPDKSAEWNRGAFLVEGPGHCGECHTPRNFMQAVKRSDTYAGALVEGWHAYNISSDPTYGIGNWSVEELSHYLAKGFTPGRGLANGPMAEVVERSLRHLSEADIRAMAVYLKSTPPQATGVMPPMAVATVDINPVDDALGRKIFADACAGCHAITGQGVNTKVATLTGIKSLNDSSAANLLGTLLLGHETDERSRDYYMPGFIRTYESREIAAVSNFIAGRLGRNSGLISPAMVDERKKQLQ